MEKSLTPRRFSKVGRGEGGSWVGRFCVQRSPAKIWFFRRLADARRDEAVPHREHVGDPSRRRDFSNKNQSLTSL